MMQNMHISKCYSNYLHHPPYILLIPPAAPPTTHHHCHNRSADKEQFCVTFFYNENIKRNFQYKIPNDNERRGSGTIQPLAGQMLKRVHEAAYDLNTIKWNESKNHFFPEWLLNFIK